MTVALALAASLLWGVSDYSGGKVSRGRSTTVVALVSQTAGLVLVVALTVTAGGWSPSPAVAGWGVASGVAISATVLLFYRALAIGSMSVVAPIAATGVVVPVVAGLARGEVPSVIALVGIVAAVLGVVTAARSPAGGVRPAAHDRSVVLAVGAAVGFGTLQLTTAGGAQLSPLTTMVLMRATSTVLLGAALLATTYAARAAPRPATLTGPLVVAAVVLVGLVDTGANTVFAFASRAEDLAVVAVLAALYPAVTVLLARLVDRERLAATQWSGVATAFAGVVLIALG